MIDAMAKRRRFQGNQLVIASHNAGKVIEIGDLVRPLGVAVQAAADLNLPEPEETGDSFIANAELKLFSEALKLFSLNCANLRYPRA